jgi:hypothetical protein
MFKASEAMMAHCKSGILRRRPRKILRDWDWASIIQVENDELRELTFVMENRDMPKTLVEDCQGWKV